MTKMLLYGLFRIIRGKFNEIISAGMRTHAELVEAGVQVGMTFQMRIAFVNLTF